MDVKLYLYFLMFLGTMLECQVCEAYKGLFVMVAGTKSNLNFFGGVMKALSQNGHQITFITPKDAKLHIENVTEVVLKEDYTDRFLGNTFKFNMQKSFTSFQNYGVKSCIEAFLEPNVQKALEEDYDYMMMSMYFADCFLYYPYERKIPLIYVNPNIMMRPYSDRLGAPEYPSVTPNKILKFTYPLSFWERTINALLTLSISISNYYIIDPKIEAASRENKIWPEQAPSIYELQRYASMVIINAIRALEIPIKPTPPAIIYAGGIHIQEPKNLTQDLEDWINGSGEDGFILFSLGTAVKPQHINQEHLESIIKVFRTLPQRIIWKWDENVIQDLPKNVMIKSWLPQTDILAHKKLRLFITHGGLFSTQEATYFEVPVLGMPVFADQIANVAEVVSEGWGEKVTWEELNEEKFRNAINKVLSDPGMKEVAATRSRLMRDWPRNPNDEVSFWVDYVIRHKGARHLQSPLVHLKWYQIHNLDVRAFVITTVIAVVTLIVMVMIKLVKLCFRKSSTKKKKKE